MLQMKNYTDKQTLTKVNLAFYPTEQVNRISPYIAVHLQFCYSRSSIVALKKIRNSKINS